MNIFEGGRRVLYAVTALVIGVTILLSWTQEPYIEAGLYQVAPSGDAVPVKNCPDVAGHRANAGIPGAEVMLTVCGEGGGEAIHLERLELARLEGMVTSERIEKSKGLGSQVIVALGVFWLFALLFGWVLRGFMGIPRGQDKK